MQAMHSSCLNTQQVQASWPKAPVPRLPHPCQHQAPIAWEWPTKESCMRVHRLQMHAKSPRAALSTLSNGILSVIKDEQKYAAESYRQDPELLDGPPNDFELEDERGTRSICLMKEYKDEQILVDLGLGKQDGEIDVEYDEEDEDEDESDESLPEVHFRVSVTKEKGVLVFECSSNGQYITIKEVALDDQEEDDDEEEEDTIGESYTGPPFSDLDDTLQQAFLDYLEERGITAELGRYLQLLCEDKAALEYANWLQRVRDFFSH